MAQPKNFDSVARIRFAVGPPFSLATADTRPGNRAAVDLGQLQRMQWFGILLKMALGLD